MTPKEKAKDLMEKYRVYADASMLSLSDNARYCSLFCVDEVLSNIPMYTGDLNPKWKYWYQVKQELEKL